MDGDWRKKEWEGGIEKVREIRAIVILELSLICGYYAVQGTVINCRIRTVNTGSNKHIVGHTFVPWAVQEIISMAGQGPGAQGL